MGGIKAKARQTWLRGLINKFDEGNVSAFASRLKMNVTTVNLLVNGKRDVSEKMVVRYGGR